MQLNAKYFLSCQLITPWKTGTLTWDNNITINNATGLLKVTSSGIQHTIYLQWWGCCEYPVLVGQISDPFTRFWSDSSSNKLEVQTDNFLAILTQLCLVPPFWRWCVFDQKSQINSGINHVLKCNWAFHSQFPILPILHPLILSVP